MAEELKHECGVAMVVLRKPSSSTGDFGGTKLSLLLEKQHNRGQDGAGVAILCSNPAFGAPPYWIAKSASGTPLTDVLGMIGNRERCSGRKESIFLGHLRYATFGKNDEAFCHPFVHEASDLAHTLLLAGNFNLTNAAELFENYSHAGSFPTSKADGYLITELIAKEIAKDFNPEEQGERVERASDACLHVPAFSARQATNLPRALAATLAKADGAWMLCGMTGDGWAFATRDPCGIRPGFYYIDDEIAVVASERPAIQAAFDVPPESVKELPPGLALVVSPSGKTMFESLKVGKSGSSPDFSSSQTFKASSFQTGQRSCAFERIYFSRANDADIHRERKSLGASLLPRILEAADAPLEDIFFSYIPNSARIAFHGLLEELFLQCFSVRRRGVEENAKRVLNRGADPAPQPSIPSTPLSRLGGNLPRFGEVIVKDAKFRTFIADAAARREFYKHVYDVTYGLVRPRKDTLVVLDDSIVRGNTMKNAILPMLDRLGPKRIVIASSAPPIRYPDCYGIDMSTLGELVAFKALVNLLGSDAESKLQAALGQQAVCMLNPLAPLYARFTEEEHDAEIARLLTPPGMKAEVVVVYQTVENLRGCLCNASRQAAADVPPESQKQTSKPSNQPIGDWYFTGDYPTPGGYKVLRKAIRNYLEHTSERSY